MSEIPATEVLLRRHHGVAVGCSGQRRRRPSRCWRSAASSLSPATCGRPTRLARSATTSQRSNGLTPRRPWASVTCPQAAISCSPRTCCGHSALSPRSAICRCSRWTGPTVGPLSRSQYSLPFPDRTVPVSDTGRGDPPRRTVAARRGRRADRTSAASGADIARRSPARRCPAGRCCCSLERCRSAWTHRT